MFHDGLILYIISNELKSSIPFVIEVEKGEK